MDMNLHAAGGNVIKLGSLENPNKMPFQGVLTFLNVPSDEPPGGSGGLKVMIPVEVGKSALDSLKGMPINLAASMDDHDTNSVIGIIKDAWLGEETAKGIPVYISGHIFAKSFPEEAAAIKSAQKSLGFSYETAKTKLEVGVYNGEEVAIAKSLIFTGAAILFKDAAAYHSTSLAAKKQPIESEVHDQMENQEMVMDVNETLENKEDLTATTSEENAVEAACKTSVKSVADDEVSEESAESPLEESVESPADEAVEEESELENMKDIFNQFKSLVMQLAADVATLKASAIEKPKAEKVEENEDQETEVEASTDEEPQRRSIETNLVAKFDGYEEDSDIFASIDNKNLNTVDSMAQKLSLLFQNNQ